MQAPKYSLFQGSFFIRPDSKALVAVLLTSWHEPCCLKCHQPYILHCCQSQTRNLAAYHSFALSLWYLVPVKIRERRRESSISWVIQAYKLVCLLGVIIEKDWETWLLACNSALFWGAGYLTRLYRPRHSFKAWLPYHEPASEVLGRGRDFVGKRPWGFKVWKIVLPRFLTLSGDLGLLCRRREDDIRNWAWKVCGRCWHSWYCCKRTPPWEEAVPNHSARSWRRLGGRLPSYYSASQFGRPFAGGRRWRVSAWCRGNSIAMTRTLRWKKTPGR